MKNLDRHSLLYKTAKKRARDIKAFYISLCCYCIVIPILMYVNLTYMPEFHWFYFSMIGWGFGLLFHAMNAFQWNPILGKGWEDRKLKQFIEEEIQKQNQSKTQRHGNQQ